MKLWNILQQLESIHVMYTTATRINLRNLIEVKKEKDTQHSKYHYVD